MYKLTAFTNFYCRKVAWFRANLKARKSCWSLDARHFLSAFCLRYLPSIHCYADDTQLYLAISPNTPAADSAVQAMRDCIMDLRNWMINDRLLLNDDKTEFLLLGTRQQLAKVNIATITVGNTEVTSGTAVKNLGAWFDSTLGMLTHISKTCSAAFYYLHNISHIRKFLSLEDTKTLVHAFLTSSLLYGTPASHLNKVQRVLNAAARLVCRAPRYWLPIRQRIHFKMLLFTFKAIHGIAPLYIQDLVQVKLQGAYNLRPPEQFYWMHLL